MTSWGGTSRTIVRSETRSIRSIGQKTRINPGPLGSGVLLNATASSAIRREDSALIERIPERNRAISESFGALERELLDLDARLREVGKAAAGQTLLASHPVYQYLADAYGLSIESLHLEPKQELSQDDWRTLDGLLEQHRAEWMLWEGAPLASTQSALRARGVSVIVFSPAGQRPAEGDFLGVMRENVRELECAAGVTTCP